MNSLLAILEVSTNKNTISSRTSMFELVKSYTIHRNLAIVAGYRDLSLTKTA